jgi:hypothetical protein
MLSLGGTHKHMWIGSEISSPSSNSTLICRIALG